MGLNFLIVDDSATTRSVIGRVLKGTALPIGDIWEAANGREGIQMMKENWIDLVLADLNMPEMDGNAMIDAMKDDPLLSKIPVVVVSSEGNDHVVESLVNRGVLEVVRKPFTPILLKGVVEKVLGLTADAGV